MARLAAESILHGLVATLAIAAILAVGRVRTPQLRLRFWLVAIALPVLFTPLAALLAPVRLGESFRDEWSLWSGSHFSLLRWHGIGAGSVVALVLAAAGVLLTLRDLVPFLGEALRTRGHRRRLAAVPEALLHQVAVAARALHMEAPALKVLASPEALLSCRGWRRPCIVASTGLLATLAPEECEAAVAHEVAHAGHRDPVLGWGLMFVRLLFLFNPFVQLCARAVAHELECRADAEAAVASHGPEPVVRSLRKLTGGAADAGARQGWHALRVSAVEARCRLLLDASPTLPVPGWALPATTLVLGGILFLTVV